MTQVALLRIDVLVHRREVRKNGKLLSAAANSQLFAKETTKRAQEKVHKGVRNITTSQKPVWVPTFLRNYTFLGDFEPFDLRRYRSGGAHRNSIVELLVLTLIGYYFSAI